MEQKQKQTIKQNSCGSTYDELPPELQCAKYPLFVAQMQETQIFYTIPNPQLLYRCQIPELVGTVILASFHGWVVLSKHPTWFLWNPLTSKLICLPPLIYLKHEPTQCCLSSPPDDPTSVFLLSTHGFPILTFCWLDCTKNELKWATYSYRKELRRIIGQEQSLRRPNLELNLPYSYRFPTFHDKDIYALNHDGRLDVYREMDEVKYTLETVVAKPPGCVGSSFLVECEKHLLLVIVGILEESVNLFKLNDFTKEWEKLDGLGKHTIYIADTCFCIEAKTPETENKIYFSKLYNGKIVFYSFKTLSYHTSDGENIKGSLHNFLATKFQCHPHTWIEPSWS